jgi:SAM-dependent methyltransferase
VFVEALAAGLPVVATAMGGALEIVDESCGVLVPPDSGRLAEALLELVQSPRRRQELARAAPARARSLCDPSTQLPALAAALASILPSVQGARHESARAKLSEGRSDEPIHALVRRIVDAKEGGYRRVVDLGCGRGDAAAALHGTYGSYTGVDIVEYEGFPRGAGISFLKANLEESLPLEDQAADLVVSIETIEHLENPRRFIREVVRLVRPGGRVVVTTPNQLSLASKLHLVFRNQFQAFQEAPGLYPSHITALVEGDLRRIARECGLVDIDIYFTDVGRIPFMPYKWPRDWGARGRMFSDNLLLTARRPDEIPAMLSHRESP